MVIPSAVTWYGGKNFHKHNIGIVFITINRETSKGKSGGENYLQLYRIAFN